MLVSASGVLIACALVCSAVAGQDQEDQTSDTTGTASEQIALSPEQAVALVRRLILAGKLDEADRLLEAIRSDPERRYDYLFLKGQIAEQRGKNAVAAEYYRAILADDPTLVRVRLDLARALFLDGDYETAKYHFDIALSQDLPEEVEQAVERFRAAIRRQKPWNFDFSFGVAPDTNLNAAPDDNQVLLFGLPFDLSEDARQTSGIGVTASGGVSHRFRLFDWLQWSSSVSARHAEYNGRTFDDTFASVQSGPRVVLGSSTVALNASYFRRWFGHDPLFEGTGVRLSGEYQLSQRLRLGDLLGFDKIDHKRTDLRDGPNYSLLLQSVLGLDEVSLARIYGGFTREVVASKPLRNWRFQLGGAYRRELPFGLTAELTVESGFRPFDATLVAFGDRREDVSISAGFRLTKRDWDLWGFAPVVGYRYVRNFSNIDFFSYSRHRGNFEFTRAF